MGPEAAGAKGGVGSGSLKWWSGQRQGQLVGPAAAAAWSDGGAAVAEGEVGEAEDAEAGEGAGEAAEIHYSDDGEADTAEGASDGDGGGGADGDGRWASGGAGADGGDSEATATERRRIENTAGGKRQQATDERARGGRGTGKHTSAGDRDLQ